VTTQRAYSVFVNSTDGFHDTWDPFFHLLHDFWPEAGPVTLNTETKSYAHPSMEIISTRVARDGETRIPWGECMQRALEVIPTEMFVYLQDDYFLYDRVDTERIDEAARVMESEGLDCLRLMECGGAGPWAPTTYPWLWSVSRRSPYRISLQAGLWTKTAMRKYLRRHESAWQFEPWGSRRAARIPGEIWCVSRDMFGEDRPQVVPYLPTGIVRGRWNRAAVEDLFAGHGLRVPFDERGWWDPVVPVRSSLGAKVVKLPSFAWARLRSL